MKKVMNSVLALFMMITVVYTNVTPVVAEEGNDEVVNEVLPEGVEKQEETIEETAEEKEEETPVEENTEEPVEPEQTEEPVEEVEEEVVLATLVEPSMVFDNGTGSIVNAIRAELGKPVTAVKLTISNPDNMMQDSLNYRSDNGSVVKVDPTTGALTALAAGTAKITAEAKFTASASSTHTKEATYTVTVVKPTPVINFAASAITKYPNEKFAYPVTLTDTGANTTIGSYKVTYTSNNPGVLTVNADGTFTTKGYGDAVITANAVKTDNATAKAAPVSLKVSVVVKPVTLKVTSNKKKYFKISWGQGDATKYEVQYSRKASFSSKKTKTYKASTLSAKIKKPSKNKNYYVRIRVAKNVNGKTLYSAWTTINTKPNNAIVANQTSVIANFDALSQRISSKTNYLVLVDVANCYTAVYQKSGGKFVRKFLWRNTCGKAETPTRTGTYTVKHKKIFFFSETSRAWYATGITAHRYLHSVLYYAKESKKWKVKDGRLGQHLSHGCIRHSIEAAEWMYKNLPIGTTVKVVDPGRLS